MKQPLASAFDSLGFGPMNEAPMPASYLTIIDRRPGVTENDRQFPPVRQVMRSVPCSRPDRGARPRVQTHVPKWFPDRPLQLAVASAPIGEFQRAAGLATQTSTTTFLPSLGVPEPASSGAYHLLVAVRPLITADGSCSKGQPVARDLDLGQRGSRK